MTDDKNNSVSESDLDELFDAARRGPQAPAVSLELLVAYIDGMLPTEDVRKDIQFLVEHDPKWRWAYAELSAAELNDSDDYEELATKRTSASNEQPTTPPIVRRENNMWSRSFGIACGVAAAIMLLATVATLTWLVKMGSESSGRMDRIQASLDKFRELTAQEAKKNDRRTSLLLCREIGQRSKARDPSASFGSSQPRGPVELVLARTLDVDLFKEALGNRDPDIRLGATIVLREYGPESNSAINELQQALSDSSHDVRVGAAVAIVQFDQQNAAVLPMLLDGARNPRWASDCLKAITSMGSAAEIVHDQLKEMLVDDIAGSQAPQEFPGTWMNLHNWDAELQEAIRATAPGSQAIPKELIVVAMKNSLKEYAFGPAVIAAGGGAGAPGPMAAFGTKELINELTSADKKRRLKALEELADRVLDPTISGVLTSNALRTLGDRTRLPVIRQLSLFLDSQDVETACSAAVVLLELKPDAFERATPPLRAALTRGDSQTVMQVLRVLRKPRFLPFNRSESFPPLSQELQELVVDKLSESEPQPTRLLAALVVKEDWRFPSRSRERALRVLAEAFASPDRATRWLAALAFGPSDFSSDMTDAVPVLVEMLHAEAENIQRFALKALGEIGPNGIPAASDILRLLRETTPPTGDPFFDVPDETRYLSAETLVQIGAHYDTAVSVLMETLKLKEPSLRAAGADALGKAGENAATAIESLEAVLREDESEYVRKAAREALNKIQRD